MQIKKKFIIGPEGGLNLQTQNVNTQQAMHPPSPWSDENDNPFAKTIFRRKKFSEDLMNVLKREVTLPTP